MQSRALSLGEARRIALAAQQFGAANAAPRDVAGITDVVQRLGAVQMDSVNVLVRSHYLPAYSRFGRYDCGLLDRAAYTDGERTLFEYWGHVASLMPVELYPLLRWRMERALHGEGTWKRMKRYATKHKPLVASVLEQIRERGALGASELDGAGKSKGSWWGWSQGKEILEWLFWTGAVTTARRRNFERLYDLTERVLPERVRNATVPKDQAQRELMTISARALGVATLRDLRDYFRLPTGDAKDRLHELLAARVLEPVAVETWDQQAYLYTGAECPRRVRVAALLSPFDSLIWERQRTERLFDFHFRLEIYTPLHKRQHGYYVLPFLLGDRLVARVDLKSERKLGRLEVRGGNVEAGVDAKKITRPLAGQLDELARWLGLERVETISRRGELMRQLRRARAARATSVRGSSTSPTSRSSR
jgi:uncharacterized protein